MKLTKAQFYMLRAIQRGGVIDEHADSVTVLHDLGLASVDNKNNIVTITLAGEDWLVMHRRGGPRPS
jgi:hypothetical protein